MVSVLVCDAALKEVNKKLLEFKYIALDSDDTEYATTQSAPITELTTNGAARSAATVSHDSETGVVTMSKQFVFTGSAPVKAICPMNNATAGQGIGLYRYLPVSGLLPALQELASSIMDFFSQIKASVAQAQQESLYDDGWRTATNSSYESMTDPRTGKPVGRSYLDIDVILGLKEGPAKVDSLTESNKALQNSMYANVGTAGLLSSAYQAAGTAAIETMNNVVNAAADKISQANAVINNLSYSNSGNSISASNYMPGMTSYQQGDGRQMFSGFRPGWRDPSPCGWGVAFESGGPVTSTGPAMLHQGEYILSRNEVNKQTGGSSANINLNVNMNNSRFGNAEMAKDLPKLFAKATRRAFVARGYV